MDKTTTKSGLLYGLALTILGMLAASLGGCQAVGGANAGSGSGAALRREPIELITGEDRRSDSQRSIALEAYHFGSGEHEIVFVGGIHGAYESGTVVAAFRIIEEINAGRIEIPEGVTVTIIPSANPQKTYAGAPTGETVEINGTRHILYSVNDVVAPQSGSNITDYKLHPRMNPNGVDLNRNWECNRISNPEFRGGTIPGGGGTANYSEAENDALFRHFTSSVKPSAVIFLHSVVSGGAANGARCRDEAHTDDNLEEEQSLAEAQSESLASLYATQAGYHYNSAADVEEGGVFGYSINGDASDSLTIHGIPSIAVELSVAEFNDSELRKTVPAVQAILNKYQSTAVNLDTVYDANDKLAKDAYIEVPAPWTAGVNATFGQVWNYVAGGNGPYQDSSSFHKNEDQYALDIDFEKETEVGAALPGTIVGIDAKGVNGYWRNANPNFITVMSEDSQGRALWITYAHLNFVNADLKLGDKIEQGRLLGKLISASEANSHLHLTAVANCVQRKLEEAPEIGYLCKDGDPVKIYFTGEGEITPELLMSEGILGQSEILFSPVADQYTSNNAISTGGTTPCTLGEEYAQTAYDPALEMGVFQVCQNGVWINLCVLENAGCSTMMSQYGF